MFNDLIELGKLIGGKRFLGIIIGGFLVGLFIYLFSKYQNFLDKKRMKEEKEGEREIKEAREYILGTAEREKEVKKLLQAEEKEEHKIGESGSKRCPQCGLINPASAIKCDCGYLFKY